MFSDTLTLVWKNSDASTGTVDVIKVNQDGYATERRKNEAGEYFIRHNIRHSNYTDKSRGNVKVDRHNIECVFDQVLDDGTVARGKCYMVLELDPSFPTLIARAVFSSIGTFLNDANYAKITGWES